MFFIKNISFCKIKVLFLQKYFTLIILDIHDKDIIIGLHKDCLKAMKQLFEVYYKQLCFYSMRYVVTMSIAEEVVSDVMYKIWQNRHYEYRAETFRDYLYTATRNTAFNYLRQQQTYKALSDNWADTVRGELIEETPLDAIITKEIKSKLNELMKTLPDQCRKAFLMSRVEDMSYDEIASKMDISPNTVKYHIKIALQKLRDGINHTMALLVFFRFFFNDFLYNPYTFFLLSLLITTRISI